MFSLGHSVVSVNQCATVVIILHTDCSNLPYEKNNSLLLQKLFVRRVCFFFRFPGPH